VGLHIQNLGDAALHDEEVRVVDIELHGVEKVLNLPSLRGVAVDEVLALSPDENLPRDGNLGGALVTDWGRVGIRVVENNGHDSLVHSRLTLLVHKLVQVARTDLAKIGNSEHETDGVQDVGLSTSIQASDSIEVGVKPEKRDEKEGSRG